MAKKISVLTTLVVLSIQFALAQTQQSPVRLLIKQRVLIEKQQSDWYRNKNLRFAHKSAGDLISFTNKYLRYLTVENINDSLANYLQSDSIIMIEPIGVCRVNYTFNIDSTYILQKPKADSNVLRNISAAMKNRIHRGSTLINLREQEIKELYSSLAAKLLFIKTRKSVDFSLKIPRSLRSNSLLVIPFYEWNETSKSFNEDTGYYNNGSYDWRWTACKAFLLIVDTRNEKVLFYKYQSYAGGSLRKLNGRLLNRLFKQCMKKGILR
ncbi:MAG: hypothetical protein JSS79_07690 [Bacteroidetes bacterium]|nr:hypothetical protein [Bacteroidota bacterium]